MAIEAFKIVHGIAPPCLYDCLTLKENRNNFKYANILQVPQVRTTTFYKKSFKYASAVLWSNFPEEFRKTNSFNHFKSLVAHWNGGIAMHFLQVSWRAPWSHVGRDGPNQSDQEAIQSIIPMLHLLLLTSYCCIYCFVLFSLAFFAFLFTIVLALPLLLIYLRSVVVRGLFGNYWDSAGFLINTQRTLFIIWYLQWYHISFVEPC